MRMNEDIISQEAQNYSHFKPLDILSGNSSLFNRTTNQSMTKSVAPGFVRMSYLFGSVDFPLNTSASALRGPLFLPWKAVACARKRDCRRHVLLRDAMPFNAVAQSDIQLAACRQNSYRRVGLAVERSSPLSGPRILCTRAQTRTSR